MNKSPTLKERKEDNILTLQPKDYIEFYGGLYIGNKGENTIKIELPSKAIVIISPKPL